MYRLYCQLCHPLKDGKDTLENRQPDGKFDLSSCSDGPEAVDRKRGSGVTVYYGVQEHGTSAWIFDIALANVLHEGSAVTIYGIDGAMQDERIVNRTPCHAAPA